MFFEKKELTFYEKPGCMGNKKQKELLWSHGITLEVKSILDEAWNKERLETFFDGLSNQAIVNQFASQIKKGEINIEKLTQDELINLMIKEPILIKRPLIEVKGEKVCGFDLEKLSHLLNINLESEKRLDSCQSGDKCV